MQTQTKVLIATVAVAGVAAIALGGSKKRSSATDTTGGGGGNPDAGGQPVDPSLSYAQQQRICRRLRNLGAPVRWAPGKRKCVRRSEPEAPPPPKNTTPPPAPGSPAASALCSAPEQLAVSHVAILLGTVAWPAYKKVVGDEIAPSAGMHSQAVSAAKSAIKALCTGIGSADVDGVADDFARAAAAIEAGSRYGAPIETSTAIGRLCRYDQGKTLPLDTTQVLALLVDVGIDGLRRNWNREAIIAKLSTCTNPPASATTLRTIAGGIADGAAFVRGEMGL